MFCGLSLLGVQKNILVLITITLGKKKKKGKPQCIASEDNIFFVLTRLNPVIFPSLLFFLKNKDISETCSYMDRKILLKVGLEVKLVN